MFRRSLSIACLWPSILILVCTSALWVRSHWFWDNVAWYSFTPRDANRPHDGGEGLNLGASSISGGLHLYGIRFSMTTGSFHFGDRQLQFHSRPVPRPSSDAIQVQPPSGEVSEWSFLGFASDSIRTNDQVRSEVFRSFTIPFWFMSLIACVIPARYLLRRHRSRYRASRGLCLACGYDLRGSSERCPECGRSVSLVPVGATPR